MENSFALRLTAAEKSKFLGRCYGWMALALFLSSVTAFFTAANIFTFSPDGRPVLTALGKILFAGNGMGYIFLCVIEIALVLFLTAGIRKMSVGAACAFFIVYSIVNGFTLSSIFAVYQITSIANAFLATSITFVLMCLWGSKTKSDLSKLGRYCVMALLGVVLATVLHVVLMLITKAPLAMLDLVISIATVLIFTGLTAYDSQKILRTAENARNNADFKKVAILGALELYLDFINLLLALLRLFGKKRD